jgi:SAM-dependent methyltransferase
MRALPTWQRRLFWSWYARHWDALYRGGGADVVGVDFAAGMLACAAEKADRAGVRLELRRADLKRRLPFDDGSFDGAVCSYVLQVVQDGVAVLDEIRRVLAPGGVLLVEVPVAGAARRDPPRRPQHRFVWTLEAMLERLPGAARAYGPERLRDELGRAGYSLRGERAFSRSYAALASAPWRGGESDSPRLAICRENHHGGDEAVASAVPSPAAARTARDPAVRRTRA